MTMLRAGADGISPGVPLPPGTTILAAYVGRRNLPGQPDARRIWTGDEWNLYLDPDSPLYGGPELRPLPIMVHDYVSDPIAVADNAIDAMLELGWEQGVGRLLYLDIETLIAGAYVRAAADRAAARGFNMGKYGSQGTINQNPAVPGGTWMATDSKIPPLTLPGDRVGDQWLFGGPWDLTGWSEFVYENCGRGLRK